MGFIAGSLRNRLVGDSSLSNPQAWLIDAFGGRATRSGVTVDERSALGISTVYACVRATSEDTAKVPLKVYRRVGDGKEEAASHRVNYLLNRQANEDFVTALHLREFLVSRGMLWGNGYAEIERDRGGRPWSLWPIESYRVTPRRREDGAILYDVVREDGTVDVIEAPDMLHVRGPGNGLVGWSVVKIARESLGLAAAQEQFASAMFGNGAKPAGFLTTPNKLDDPALKRLAEWRDKIFAGISNAHKVHILEQGLKFEPMTMPLEDAQFLQSRQFQVPEICRWFRMKPHKIGDLSAATNNNIESEGLSYVGDCLQGWFGRVEGECWQKLFLRGEQDAFLVEHVYEALLRGDIGSRYNAYKTGLQWGWITLNEIRRRENMNVLPAEIGDVNFFALNMTTAKRVVDGTAQQGKTTPEAEPSPGGAPQNNEDNRAKPAPRETIANAVCTLRSILLDGTNRVLRGEVDKARRAHGRGELSSWASGFYQGHEEFLRSHWAGPVQTLRELLAQQSLTVDDEWCSRAVAAVAAKHVQDSLRDLAGQEAQMAFRIDWPGSRAADMLKGLPDLLSGI